MRPSLPAMSVPMLPAPIPPGGISQPRTSPCSTCCFPWQQPFQGPLGSPNYQVLQSRVREAPGGYRFPECTQGHSARSTQRSPSRTCPSAFKDKKTDFSIITIITHLTIAEPTMDQSELRASSRSPQELRVDMDLEHTCNVGQIGECGKLWPISQ